ncbi:hypothetical protein ACRAWD_27300 [Caulobacter segnis]
MLHKDATLMPRRRRAWASWNYIGADQGLCVTYWMNRLQGLSGEESLRHSQSAPSAPDLARAAHEVYEHPIFNPARSGRSVASGRCRGRRRVWFCSAYFEPDFLEAACEPGWPWRNSWAACAGWTVAGESDRIVLGPATDAGLEQAA